MSSVNLLHGTAATPRDNSDLENALVALQNVAFDFPDHLDETVRYHMCTAAHPADFAQRLLRALTGGVQEQAAIQSTLQDMGMEALYAALARYAFASGDQYQRAAQVNARGAAAPVRPSIDPPLYMAPGGGVSIPAGLAQMYCTFEGQCREYLQEAQSLAGNDLEAVRRMVNRRVRKAAAAPNAPVTMPVALRCPVTRTLFVDPVLGKDGQTYERTQIPPQVEIFSSAHTMRALADTWRTCGHQPAHELSTRLAEDLRCPITLEMCDDPVTLSDGYAYDRESCITYLESAQGDRSPYHREPLARPRVLIENLALRDFVEQLGEDPRFEEFTAERAAPNRAYRGATSEAPAAEDAEAAQAALEAIELLAEALIADLQHPPQGFFADPQNVITCLRVLGNMEQLRAQRTWYNVGNHREFASYAESLEHITTQQMRDTPTDNLPLVTIFFYGEVKRLTGDNQAAINAYRLLLEAAPETYGAEVLGRAALVMLEAGEERRAHELAAMAIETNPNNPHGLAAAGEELLRRGDYENARILLEASWERCPTREAKQSLRRLNARRRS